MSDVSQLHVCGQRVEVEHGLSPHWNAARLFGGRQRMRRDIVMAAQLRDSRTADGNDGLRIRLLGPLQIYVDGRPVPIVSRKARALLAYLAARSGTEVSRGMLAGLLWGDRGEEQARASLRQTLSELRAAFAASGVTPLLATKEAVRFVRGASWIDVEELGRFGDGSSGIEADQAISLIAGDFLEGFSLDEPSFEQWLASERERIRTIACTNLEQLARRLERDGRVEQALAARLQIVAIDPLREDVHRGVMRLYAAQGRFDTALAHFERCRRALFDALKVRPEAETEELAQSIRSQRRLPPRSNTPPSPAEAPGGQSIAVLAFANLSGTREHDVLAEAIAEELIAALSRIPEFFVVSKYSSFAQQGRGKPATEIAADLGVRYLLGGSIRIVGGDIRVISSLVDGRTGAQIWSDRYDGQLADLLSMQDELTRRVALALQIKLTQGETVRFWEGQTRNLRAWEKMVEAREHWGRFSKVENAIARRLLLEAIDIDPSYTGAMALLGMTHWWDARFNPNVDRQASLALAEEQVARLQGLDPGSGTGLMLQAGVAFLRDRHDEALAVCEHSVALAPSDFHTVAFLGVLRLYAGDYSGGIASLKAAMRINPTFKPWVTYNLSVASLAAGETKSALTLAESYVNGDPGDPYAYLNLALALIANGRADEAPACIDEMRGKFDDITIEEYVASHRFRDKAWLAQLVDWLRSAGVR